MNGSRLLVRLIVLMIPLTLGCETAAILLGGAGVFYQVDPITQITIQ
jgi:hypothetical protein